MRTFDPTPLWRSTIGFDHLFDLLNTSIQRTSEENYPPYNIERSGEDRYQITLAVAGFAPDEVTIMAAHQFVSAPQVQGRHSLFRSPAYHTCTESAAKISPNKRS